MSWLTEGPRGRRLLWELRDVEDPTDAEVLTAFADSVAWARYWQEPDDVDLRLADKASALEDRVTPAAWWSGPVALDEQVVVRWEGEAPTLTGAADKLQAWYDATVADEVQAAKERPTDLTASWSGHWWSTPGMSRLPVTSRATPGTRLVEDPFGHTEADLTPVAPTRAVRVFEIQSPTDWARFVTACPLVVTASRRHDWWRATGATGELLIPDYRAASAEWDGVHVSARGYLTTATRALPVGGGTTVLAGWDPDQTWWLTDCLAMTGPAVRHTL